MGLDYAVKPINISQGDQMTPAFLAMNRNHKIPVLVDSDGTVVNESNTILLKLTQDTRKFAPSQGSPDYWVMLEWLMWQASGFGPMLGQTHHFVHFNPGKSAYAETRFQTEAKRLYGVLNTRLTGRTYMLDEISILEFAIWPWASRFEFQRIDLNEFPAVKDWYLRLADRPAFQRGYVQPSGTGPIPRPA